MFHIARGEPIVAWDLLTFLDTEAHALRQNDPEGRLAATEDLAANIRRALEVNTPEKT